MKLKKNSKFCSKLGFKLQCTSMNNQVIEKTLHGSDIDTFTFNKLQCGSKYEFTIQAYNSVGFSDKTQSVFIKTNGSGKFSSKYI